MACQNHAAFDLEAEQVDCIDLTLEDDADSWRVYVAEQIVKIDMIDLRYLAYSQCKFQVYKEFQRVGGPDQINREQSPLPVSKPVDIRAPPVQRIHCTGKEKGRLRLEEVAPTINSRMSENKSDDRETQCGSVSIKLPSSSHRLLGLRKRKPRGDSFLDEPLPTTLPRLGTKSIRQRSLKKNALASGRTLLGGLPRDINELTTTLFDWKAFDKCYLHAASVDAIEAAFSSIYTKPLVIDHSMPSEELETLLQWLATVLKKARDNQLRVLLVGKGSIEYGSRLDLRGCIADFRVLPSTESCTKPLDTAAKTATVVPGHQLFDLDYVLLGKRIARKPTKAVQTPPAQVEGFGQNLELVNLQLLNHHLTNEMVERQIFFGPEFARLKEKLEDPKVAAGAEKFSLLIRSEMAFLDSRRASVGSEIDLQRQILKKRVAANAS